MSQGFAGSCTRWTLANAFLACGYSHNLMGLAIILAFSRTSLDMDGTVKVDIFWEGHNILRNLWQSKVRLRFLKIFWPSQNVWTLKCPRHPITKQKTGNRWRIPLWPVQRPNEYFFLKMINCNELHLNTKSLMDSMDFWIIEVAFQIKKCTKHFPTLQCVEISSLNGSMWFGRLWKKIVIP